MNRDNRETRPNTTRRLRLRGWDYSTPGYYFITFCTQHRVEFMGSISEAKVVLNDAGEMMHGVLQESVKKFPTLHIDAMAMMPGHVHILFGLGVRTGEEPHQANIIDVMHWIKLVYVRRYGAGVRQGRFPRYRGQLWQDGFYDAISFSDKELESFRRYIAENPERWDGWK